MTIQAYATIALFCQATANPNFVMENQCEIIIHCDFEWIDEAGWVKKYTKLNVDISEILEKVCG